MPYVDDNDDSVTMGELVRYNASGEKINSLNVALHRRSRAQRGWRSIGEADAAYADMLNKIDDFTSWGQSRQIIGAMERVERALSDPLIRNPRDLIVHDRDYTSVEEQSGLSDQLLYAPNGWSRGTTSVSLGSWNLGGKTEAQIRAIGNPMIRDSRPTKPYANLGQWFGELRDANRLVSPGVSLPGRAWTSREAAKAYGGGYLNWQFGWNGFIGELKKSAEAIIHSESLINDFLLNSSKLVRRTRTEVLSQDAVQYTGILSPNNYGWRNTTVSSPIGAVRIGVNPFSGFSSVPRSHWRAVVSWKEVVRSFAVFEYFVFDPDGALGRMRRYSQYARHLLGEPALSASTVWELTPWTWMSDWFVDVGGLLSYQESVASDSTVARRCGTVYEVTASVANHVDFRSTTSPTSYLYGSSDSFYNKKFQRRRKGSPYDLSVDWNGLSPQQWTIVGALGMTRAPGVGFA